jgi:hypothetical protein
MYNRARENYQKQLSNINNKYNKKSSPIKIKSNKNEINPKYNNITNKINIITNNNSNININIKNGKLSQNIILPKITKQNIFTNKINNNNKNSSSIQTKLDDKKINNQINKINPIKKRSMTGNKIKKPPIVELRPFQRNKKLLTVKKRYLKDNNLYTIVTFLDIRTIYFFMLCCKQFYKIANECDDVWYNFYIIKFCKPPKEKIEYLIHRGNWKKLYLSSSKAIYAKNYEDLKNKYLKKYKKNIYTAKKDPYYLTNNLYKNMKKPLYCIEIDKSIYQVKYILTNKILSHINFFANFDEIYQDLNKIKTIKLLFTEQSIGIYRKPIAIYDIKKIGLKCSETEGIKNKIFKIYYYKDLIISTFDKNNIFFINMSIPVCKLCENIFDFIDGIHTKNLNYECDCDSKFGLYDYSLLINLKSWNKIFFSLMVNTCDLKYDEEEDKTCFYYIDKSNLVSKYPLNLDLKSLVIENNINNFMIFDIMFLTYNGDHVLCDSKPIILKEDKTRIDYDEYNSEHFIGIVDDDNYNIKFDFNINEKEKYYALIRTEIRVNKKYIENIFKKF